MNKIDDGWYRVADEGEQAVMILYVHHGVIGDDKVEWYLEQGYTFEPRHVLTVTEHDELTATIATLRAQVAIPDEVAQTMRKLLNDERQAIKEYHYDVYGKEDLTARLSVIDNAFAWLDQQQKGHTHAAP